MTLSAAVAVVAASPGLVVAMAVLAAVAVVAATPGLVVAMAVLVARALSENGHAIKQRG